MDKIQFTVNGHTYTLSGAEVSPVTSLNDYLRNYLQLHGTKAMCHEGGCGACVVCVTRTHPGTAEKDVFSVNSCLVHILSCHQWDITTIEGVGNRRDGYHAIQQRLAQFNGTQCGYCSPGMVMNMYSLQKRSSKLTMKGVEDSFGGNICRCTGYRPVLDAFKSFATDLSPGLKIKLQDVEELDKLKCLKLCDRKSQTREDDEWCFIENDDQALKDVAMNSGRWYKAFTVEDVFKVLARSKTDSYRFVAGNTGQGVYPIGSQPEIFIDISSIPSMKDCLTDENLVIGAGLSLTELMVTCQHWSTNSDFGYLAEFYKHLDLVAHVPVRNVGTIGGNLALKNMHHDFPSDIFLFLATVGAVVTLVNSAQTKTILTMQDFMKMNLKNLLILDVKLPPMANSSLLRTYKIMPRAQNAHAIVNAGFLLKLDSLKKVTSANIVFGNINPTFVTASNTVHTLLGEDLFDDKTLQKALLSLKEELVPVDAPPEPSPECRKILALGLFYKAVLSFAPSVSPRYKSGGELLQREISRGTQTFDTDKTLWPLNKPVQKLEAITQCSGEADYACDVPTPPGTVQVAFVLSTIFKGEVESFDPADALKQPGVIAFFSSKDIPGKNSFTCTDVPWNGSDEEILATSVFYYGQPIAVIAAMTRKHALEAAGLVKVKYKKSEDKPVLNVRDALTAPDKDRRVRQDVNIEPTDHGSDVTRTIRGRFTIPSQYHYTMETQSCTVSNNARGVTARSATQWIDLINVAVGNALDIDHNSVEVIVPRIGGGYGGKASRSSHIACACAVVAYKLNRTATLVMPITDNMTAMGKRCQCELDYEISTNDAGIIQLVNITYYSDCGFSYNDSMGDLGRRMGTLYDVSRWKIVGYSVLTDKASNTWCRAPGTTEAMAIAEHIMERIAFATKKDPTEIRLAHLAKENLVVKEIVTDFLKECDFPERKAEIDKFNNENAWKKKALRTSLMAYPIEYSWNFPVTISIHHVDGTVSMGHGGIEMGQGINTKVAQVCAFTLKIPLEKVRVRPSDNYTSTNTMVSNGSITSDCVAYATIKACEVLLMRLKPVKESLDKPTWEAVVKAAFNKGINLQASYMTSPSDNLQNYNVYGVGVAEIELDVLTGNHQIRRMDILEDTGVSISPDIDVGQIEGAFIMGLGLWTSEHLVYDKEGRLLTNRTWTYKPPGAKDIPADFRVSFRRNSPNAAGVLRSKATGEPAFVLAVVLIFALHDAILEARKEFGYNDTEWLHIDSPYTVEHILKAISAKTDHFKIN